MCEPINHTNLSFKCSLVEKELNFGGLVVSAGISSILCTKTEHPFASKVVCL